MARCIGNIAPVTDASEKLLAQSQVGIEAQILKQDKMKSLDDEQDIMKVSSLIQIQYQVFIIFTCF